MGMAFLVIEMPSGPSLALPSLAPGPVSYVDLEMPSTPDNEPLEDIPDFRRL